MERTEFRDGFDLHKTREEGSERVMQNELGFFDSVVGLVSGERIWAVMPVKEAMFWEVEEEEEEEEKERSLI